MKDWIVNLFKRQIDHEAHDEHANAADKELRDAEKRIAAARAEIRAISRR